MARREMLSSTRPSLLPPRPDKYCLDLGAARQLKAAGADVAVLRVWQGSTSLYSDWAAPPNSGARDLFGILSDEGAAAVVDPTFPLGSDYVVRVLWAQGEADAGSALHSSNYQSRLQDWWDAFKALPWVPDNAEIDVLRLNVNSANAFTADVRTAQAAFVAANADAYLLDADDLPLADSFHYASIDADVVGVRAADAIITRTPGLTAPPEPEGRTYRTVLPSSTDYLSIASASRPAVTDVHTVWCAWMTGAANLTREQEIWTAFGGSSGYRHLLRDGSPGRLLLGYRDGGGTSRFGQQTMPARTAGEVQRSCFVFRINGANYELEQYQNGASLGVTSIATSNGFSDAAGLSLDVIRQASGSNVDNTRILGVAFGAVALSDTEVAAHDAAVVAGGDFGFTGATHLFDAAGLRWRRHLVRLYQRCVGRRHRNARTRHHRTHVGHVSDEEDARRVHRGDVSRGMGQARKVPTEQDIPAMPLDPTPAETAKAIYDREHESVAELFAPDDVPTTPGVPSKTLKRRAVSEGALQSSVELVCLQLESSEPDRERIADIISKEMSRVLHQGRREMAKQISDLMSDLQEESARRSESEVEAITQSRFRHAAESKLTQLRSTLLRVRDGELLPKEIDL